MNLFQRLSLFRSFSKIQLIISQGVKTTSTVHPSTVYEQDEKLLSKVMEERSSDMPQTLENPYKKEDRKCILCEHKIQPNFKNVKLLYQFVSPYTGMPYERHVTGLCTEMQNLVKTEIRKAQYMGLMGVYFKEAEFFKDPKICDPERPIRPHKY